MRPVFLHNHLGYALAGPKTALLQAPADFAGRSFQLLDARSGTVHRSGPLKPLGSPARWGQAHYWEADFSAHREAGEVMLGAEGVALPSRPFTISAQPYDGQLISNLLHYVKSQRCTGVFDAADRDCPVLGSDERVDVHGGWYDASGDCSKYLSHLSYANFMNPQQTPLLVWTLIESRALAPPAPVWLDERWVDEALHGADFLCRMQHPSGYFYATVFDRWSKDIGQRMVCAYATQKGIRSSQYRAGWRQGGGLAIAALARASGLPRDGESARTAYLAAAEQGFAHLAAHGLGYLNDGQENLLDDYCALLAATELAAATGHAAYAEAAAQRVERIAARQHEDGWFWANDAGTRSFFHAVDAGLPHLALLRTLDVLPQGRAAERARWTLIRGLRAELHLTLEGEANPFRYPRQWVARGGQPGRAQFFIPHDNESGYWWQGENARLASLASAALRAIHVLPWADSEARQLHRYALDALHWIFGLNPFDACMMQGQGHHNPRYEAGYWNAPGGVCNGITAGLEDEEGIDFRAPSETVPEHSWRWSEQWLPHGAWLLLALAQLQSPEGLPRW